MGVYRSGDPDFDFRKWDQEQQAWEDSLPKCDICGDPIDDHVYEIEDIRYCVSCMEKKYRRSVI